MWLVLSMVWIVLGCRGDSTEEVAESTATGARTVVSLSPAITTTMIDLGASDRLVGRTPWCRGVDGLPVTGTLEGIDAEILVSLEPSVVLHQPAATGTDPVLLALRDRMGFELAGGRLDGVDDVLRLLDEIERLELAESGRLEERRLAMKNIGAMTVDRDDPLAVVMHSVDPVGVAGENTYLGEIARAGGLRNAAGSGAWSEWSVETLIGADPDVLVVFAAPGSEARVRTQLAAIRWPRPPSVVVISNPDAFEPSTRMPGVLESLRDRLAEVGIKRNEPTASGGRDAD